jgi:hypothetical protein
MDYINNLCDHFMNSKCSPYYTLSLIHIMYLGDEVLTIFKIYRKQFITDGWKTLCLQCWVYLLQNRIEI